MSEQPKLFVDEGSVPPLAGRRYADFCRTSSGRATQVRELVAWEDGWDSAIIALTHGEEPLTPDELAAVKTLRARALGLKDDTKPRFAIARGEKYLSAHMVFEAISADDAIKFESRIEAIDERDYWDPDEARVVVIEQRDGVWVERRPA